MISTRIKQTSIIIDTDFGGDPDDAIALLYALCSPAIKILAIITSDEYKKTGRAELITKWLRLKKISVPVFSGHDLGNMNLFLFKDKIDGKTEVAQLATSNVIEGILHRLVEEGGYYISIGALSNCAYLLKRFPNIFEKIPILIMGGAINYRRPGIAEHNIRLDISSARSVIQSELQTSWLLSDHTFVPETVLSTASTVYRFLEKSKDKFHMLVKENMDRFYREKYPQSHLHDPILVSSLSHDLIKYETLPIVCTEKGEFKINKEGIKMRVSRKVNYHRFWKHLLDTIAPST